MNDVTLKPGCEPCKRGIHRKEFKTDNFVTNVCGNCEHKKVKSMEEEKKQEIEESDVDDDIDSAADEDLDSAADEDLDSDSDNSVANEDTMNTNKKESVEEESEGESKLSWPLIIFFIIVLAAVFIYILTH